MTLLRVLTYNIWLGGRAGQPLYDVVRAVAPDVALVNECPKQPVRWRRDCRRLADAWDLRVVTGGRPAGSNLVLAAAGVGVKAAASTRIAQPAGSPRRGVASAQLRVGGALVGVVSCHLGLVRESRPAELDVVLRAADALRGPVVLAGDLNETPDGPCWDRLRAAGFVDHGDRRWRTFPASAPARRIDALLLRGTATVRHHGAPPVDPALLATASDHRPVLAEIELG